MEADPAPFYWFHPSDPYADSCTMDGDWVSRAEVLETSALSCGVSFAMSLVNTVASWLAREIET